MCVDIDFRLFSDKKAQNIPERHKKKINEVAITFFPKLIYRCSVTDG